MAMWLGIGGFLGAISRYGLSRLAQQMLGGAWPYGTWMVNLLGSFLLAAFAAWLVRHPQSLHPVLVKALSAGFLGSFTTMSTFIMETHMFWLSGYYAKAAGYGVATLFACLLGAAVGYKCT